ncbi:SRPBCC family protein [Amycolatopsis magusensis]|uniref:Uncharacterized protein YndB with AHSA1/START domain n=1 Tax=Amycolatopsis magusensis TaxID=882444 RepID=A0ABS4PZ87_9PSEU|nr:SRPBCC family protein [Amycolatopsis magusensis]MBP2184220.1 uncharacterized protein YndB with AHSA1/START domain [Amycolatopsis magusensis]MDI5981317.1 SRPBCC family protein [Amycolatopsis magusensis]
MAERQDNLLTRQRSIAAPADLVLNTAADVTQVPAWLPGPVRLVDPGQIDVRAGSGTIHVAAGDGGESAYEVVVDPARQVLSWTPADPGGWPGELRVSDGGAGSSVAELRVRPPGSPAGVAEHLDRALDGLAVAVAQNFNVS